MKAFYVYWAATGLGLGLSVTAACSSANSGNDFGNGGSAATAATGGTGANGTGGADSGIAFDSGTPESGGPTDASACSKLTAKTELELKPVDIIFVVDNSCSMDKESQAIEQNINTNFAQIISASGIDYRVVMISQHSPSTKTIGAYYGICVGAPLGGSLCPITEVKAPTNNPPLYHAYDKLYVNSHDTLCRLLEWYDQPDRYNLAPGGYKDYLRTEAFKIFVSFTDDGISCSYGGKTYNDSNSVSGGTNVGQQWDADILARDPAMFGTVADRNYAFYSVIGIGSNPANPNKSWSPTDPINTTECTTAVDPGTGYQQISNMTGGLKFPVCEGSGFDVVFSELAKGVIKGAKIACEFDVPEAPKGKEIDLSSVGVGFTPGTGGPQQKFNQVANQAACTPTSFYIEAGKIRLCQAACLVVQNDTAGQLDVLIDCLKDIPK